MEEERESRARVTRMSPQPRPPTREIWGDGREGGEEEGGEGMLGFESIVLTNIFSAPVRVLTSASFGHTTPWPLGSPILSCASSAAPKTFCQEDEERLGGCGMVL